jgi:hypothetical protein
MLLFLGGVKVYYYYSLYSSLNKIKIDTLSLFFMWHACFGLFACLDFGPSPLLGLSYKGIVGTPFEWV